MENPPNNPPTDANSAPKSSVLALSIKDKAVLFAAYMPFITPGAIFIPTQRDFQWGEEINISLSLMDDPNRYQVKTKVVWITPKNSQGNRSPGIGVQFLGDEGKELRDKMETYLAGALDSDNPTHTL